MVWNKDVERPLADAFNVRDFDTFRDILRRNPGNVRTVKGRDGWLCKSASAGLFDFVKFLVEEMGVDADDKSLLYKRQMPAFEALRNGHRDIALWLLERYSDLNTEYKGQTDCLELTLAVTMDDIELVKWLIDRGADVDSISAENSTAIMGPKSDAMRECLRTASGFELPDSSPKSADVEAGHEQILQFLKQHSDSEGGWGDLGKWVLEFPGDPTIRMHCLNATEQRKSQLLFTVGVSDVVLTNPHDGDEGIELGLVLPAEWPINGCTKEDNDFNVPILMLHSLARTILHNGQLTFLFEERTGPMWSLEVHSDFPAPILPSIRFCGWLLLGEDDLTLDDEREVGIYIAVPLYEEEVTFVRTTQNHEDLLRRFMRLGIPEEFDSDRANAVTDWPPLRLEPEVDDSCST